jgi:type IV secretory pathway VirJ component
MMTMACGTVLPESLHAHVVEEGPLAGLPITEVPAIATGGHTVALLITGDGGWASLDLHVAKELTKAGIAVVGLNSADYLRRKRTPDEMAVDVTRILRYYVGTWKRDRILIVGYSRGADVAPFVVSRLPSDLRSRVVELALLGRGEGASFEFHFTDLFRMTSRPSDLRVLPELEKLRGLNMLCIYGMQEEESLCRHIDPALVKPFARPGKHHFDGDYAAVANTVMEMLPR